MYGYKIDPHLTNMTTDMEKDGQVWHQAFGPDYIAEVLIASVDKYTKGLLTHVTLPALLLSRHQHI